MNPVLVDISKALGLFLGALLLILFFNWLREIVFNRVKGGNKSF
jgi:hypothetical protein